MKNTLLFLGGLVTGIVLTVLVACVYVYSQKDKTPDGVTNFEKVEKKVNESSVKVMQVVGDNAALVHGGTANSLFPYSGQLYLLRNYEGKYYYDDEIIKKPKDKSFMQTGIYQYETKSGDYKTVPIIELR